MEENETMVTAEIETFLDSRFRGQNLTAPASDQSITNWFHAVRQGDETAADRLWNHYVRKLTSVARRRLATDVAYDEDDLAVSVFDAFFRAARDGRFGEVQNRDDLWSLLVVFAARKANDRRKNVNAAKRKLDSGIEMVPAEAAASQDDDPEFNTMMADQCRQLIEALQDPELETVALSRLDGQTNSEIAKQLDCSERTVIRMVILIRTIWTEMLEASE